MADTADLCVNLTNLNSARGSRCFYAVTWNDRRIATISRQVVSGGAVDGVIYFGEYAVTCYDNFISLGTSEINWNYSGLMDTFAVAIDRILWFIEFLQTNTKEQSND